MAGRIYAALGAKLEFEVVTDGAGDAALGPEGDHQRRYVHRPGARRAVAAILGAGFNRSTLLSSAAQPATDAASSYRTGVTDHYAKAMHAAAQDGKAHGFAFADVARFASYLPDTAPTGIRLTLTSF